MLELRSKSNNTIIENSFGHWTTYAHSLQMPAETNENIRAIVFFVMTVKLPHGCATNYDDIKHHEITAVSHALADAQPIADGKNNHVLCRQQTSSLTGSTTDPAKPSSSATRVGKLTGRS
jgi:hypothetical protein